MGKVPMTAFAAAIYEAGLLQIGDQVTDFGWHSKLGMRSGLWAGGAVDVAQGAFSRGDPFETG